MDEAGSIPGTPDDRRNHEQRCAESFINRTPIGLTPEDRSRRIDETISAGLAQRVGLAVFGYADGVGKAGPKPHSCPTTPAARTALYIAVAVLKQICRPQPQVAQTLPIS